jgi:hypothetical protein
VGTHPVVGGLDGRALFGRESHRAMPGGLFSAREKDRHYQPPQAHSSNLARGWHGVNL